MTLPATPLRLQIIDRVVAVLEAMVQGPSFFYRPNAVVKRLKNFNECGGFPTYMVFMDKGAGVPEAHLDSEYVEKLTISIQGWVDLELGEPQTKLCKCIRDVQKAIADDAKSSAAGSLGLLCSNGLCDIGTVETDNGGYSLQGYAFFSQSVDIQIVGDWGEL